MPSAKSQTTISDAKFTPSKGWPWGLNGTGKTLLPVSHGLAACTHGVQTKFFTVATLINQLEESQKQFALERMLKRLDKLDLLIVDELGHRSFSRSDAELLFQAFIERYERRSLLITSNLAFSDGGQIFQDERMALPCWTV